LFDEVKLRAAVPGLVEHDWFMQNVLTQNVSSSIWCAHSGSHVTQNVCEKGPPASLTSLLGSRNYFASPSQTWEQLESMWEGHAVIALTSYRKLAIPLTDHERAEGAWHIGFSRGMYDQADRFANKLGLDDHYQAINWRSETVATEPEIIRHCSEYLSRYGNNSLLISDMSFDPTRVLWNGMRHQSDTTKEQQEAISELVNSGFRKLDQLPEVREAASDMGHLSVLEIILGAQASNFYTCTGQDDICKKCCRTRSNFARNIINEREKLGKPSYVNWPGSVYNAEKTIKLRQLDGPDCTTTQSLNLTMSICN